MYLKNVEDYGRVNEIYADFFGTHRPARSAVAVAAIPLGVLIELDMIARYVLQHMSEWLDNLNDRALHM